MRSWLIRFAIPALAVGLAVLWGCGSMRGGPTDGSGSVSVHVQWPASTTPGRLIPQAAQSIALQVAQNELVLRETTINRPESTARLEGLPAGPTTLKAVAYPEAAAQGVAVAGGAVQFELQAGDNTIGLTLQSTIQRIEVALARGSAMVGDRVAATATPRDAQDQVVLVAPQALQWESTASNVAVVLPGFTKTSASVRAEDPGSVRIIVRDTESGQQGEATLDVAAPMPSLVLRSTTGASLDHVDEESRPSLLADLEGIPPGQAVEVALTKNLAPLYRDADGNPQPMLLTADAQGKLPALLLFPDFGVDTESGLPTPMDGQYAVSLATRWGTFDQGFDVTRSRAHRAVEPPVVWPQRSGQRFAMGSIPEGETLYAAGRLFPAEATVRLYVVPDQAQWPAGSPLADVTGIIEEVRTDGAGNLPYTSIWPAVAPVNDNRDFDLVADVDRDGAFSDGDAIAESAVTGFTVQSAQQPSFGARLPLATTQAGRYQDRFRTDDTLSIWVNPPFRRLIQYQMVRKYICVHRESWASGDVLVDVTQRTERDLVRYACGNQYCYPIWAPPMMPGTYDPVIDVNQNGVLDQGDILGTAFTVEGPKMKRLFLSPERPVINPDEETRVTAQVIDEDDRGIGGVTVDFALTGTGSLDPATQTTDANGCASTRLRAGGQGPATLYVRAAAASGGVPSEAETAVQVRGLGSIHTIIR